MTTKYYLASFPRSGNTWVRFLIANVYNHLKGEFEEIDFFNIHSVIPERKPSGRCEEPHFKELPWIIKTHSRFQGSFTNSMLLVRNPFDTLYSYWDFLNANRKMSLSLAETAGHERYGISALVEHTNSYTDNCPNLLILKYEDLKRRPAGEVRKILDFIGVSAGDKVIQAAVEKSSFASMKRIEAQGGRKFGRRDFAFIRRGDEGEGQLAFRKDEELYHFMKQMIRQSPLLQTFYDEA